MTEQINANIITLYWNSNELSDKIINYVLPNGYSFKEIRVHASNNVKEIEYGLNVVNNTTYIFPTVYGKSPCAFRFVIGDTTKASSIKIIITQFGCKPDSHYFDKAFEPILVTGKDGEEYQMIPSDQFK